MVYIMYIEFKNLLLHQNIIYYGIYCIFTRANENILEISNQHNKRDE